jgi:tetratricopeptide (TPR) repeat protein
LASFGTLWEPDLQRANPQQAIEAYRTSLSLNPRSADAWLGLASVYEGEGNLDSAREAFLNAKRCYPISAEVSWRYANFLARTGEVKAALQEARQTLRAQPQHAWEVFQLMKRFDPDTINLVDQLLPPQEIAYLDVIWGLDREGRVQDAVKVWDRLFQLDRTLPAHTVPDGDYQHTQTALLGLCDHLISKGFFSEAARV